LHVHRLTPTTISAGRAIGLQRLKDSAAISAVGIIALIGSDHASELRRSCKVVIGLGLHPVGQRLDEVGTSERIVGWRTPVFVGMICWVRSGSRTESLGGQRERLV